MLYLARELSVTLPTGDCFR